MTQSTLLPLTLSPPSSELLFPGNRVAPGLYEKLPPPPTVPGTGIAVMTLPEVRGPLYVDPAVEPTPMMDDFYTIKPWRGLDLPLLPDDISLFEERGSAVGLSHFCSVQSAHCNCAAGGGLTAGGGVGVAGAGLAEAGGMEMDMEVEVSSSCSIPESPPLLITASPESSPAAALGPSAPGLPCAQSLLEELAALEPVFGAGASIAPDLGQQPELYQLQCHPPQQCFHEDGSGSDPPF
ncbi:hypothetical protein COCON_G00044040 [Conger conger]|uniref:Uncharacterized protein n=1 Tax=Conger conger TaxID=82655 RepID=A0A9Q1DU69_CONCO|nr:hypothetical protein COCON_G00044040 [Conger conger]